MNSDQVISYRGNILIVDDLPDNIRLLRDTLSAQGYKVRSATTGAMAIRAAHSPATELILLDIKLPDLDGYEVCKQLKSDEQTESIPIIFLSALNDTFNKVQGLAVGGVDYISKPFQVEEVLARVETHLTICRLRKRLQEQNVNLAKEMEEDKHLKEIYKEEFLATMSHELRTPLNAILGMTEGMQEQVFGTIVDRQRKALQTIESSGIHLLELINEILDVAKIESGQIKLEFGSTSIPHLCQSSLAFIKKIALQKNIQIHSEIQVDLPEILVDGRRIRQVLINLLNNAVKFTSVGGSITLKVSLCQPTSLSTENSGEGKMVAMQYIQIAVIDTGIGIASENIPKLFKPFVQIDSALNRKYAGTGLGLALAKQIVELHGGRVSLTSELGVGSCFLVEFPYIPNVNASSEISPSDHSSTTSEPDLPVQNALQSPLILIAEDNEAIIRTISSYLTAQGYRLLLASNGQEAISKAMSAHPDLILMNIQMPVVDGLEAIKQIRQLPSLVNIPIIAITALVMTDDQDRCLAAGANEYLTKPVKLRQLLTIIQQLVLHKIDK